MIAVLFPIALFLLASLMLWLANRDEIRREFFRNPIGKRCRYSQCGRRHKGTVIHEYKLAKHIFMIEREGCSTVDGKHIDFIKPIYWEL